MGGLFIGAWCVARRQVYAPAKSRTAAPAAIHARLRPATVFGAATSACTVPAPVAPLAAALIAAECPESVSRLNASDQNAFPPHFDSVARDLSPEPCE